ncbi:MAG TPA: hypothetical protein VES19_02775 [Candidatus Limnocylindrales bacterium]|nr:hypothetical protein [Candidatus Limnocylindrales bacterium]
MSIEGGGSVTEPVVPVVRLEARGDRGTLRLVHAALARRQGLRRTLAAGRLALEVDAPEIERIGPEIEALATAAGLELRLVDLDARLAPSSLDGRPSGVWAAIGDAALDLELARGRDEEPAGGVYGRVTVTVEDGVRIARDGRSARVEPAGPPPDLSPVKYDDAEYHEEAAIEAGQPAEHGATHIGLFLSWLVRRDLIEPELFDERDLAEVRSGTMPGSDLLGLVDGKLVSDMLTDVGNAFAAARYGPYLDAYGTLFAAEADYSIADDAAAEAKVHPLLDGMYAHWVTAGRPDAEPKPDEEIPESWRRFAAAEHDWDAIMEVARNTPGPVAIGLRADGGFTVETMASPHADPALEALIPDDLGDGPVERMSMRGARGDVRLKRAMEILGMSTRRVTVAVGLAGKGPRVVAQDVYRVPGVGASALVDAFRSVFRPRRGHAIEIRDLEGGPVWWVDMPPELTEMATAFWAMDGILIRVHGAPTLLPGAIARIRAGL